MLKIPYTEKKKIPFAQEELKMYTCKPSLIKQTTLREVTTGFWLGSVTKNGCFIG